LIRALLISKRAEKDLQEIWRWSCEQFGEAQADRYLDELDGGIRACGSDPEDGKQRDDVRPGYRSKLVRKHVVFYTVSGDNVLIQRVLHGSMDPPRHIPGQNA